MRNAMLNVTISATPPWSWNSQKPSIDFHITIFLEDSVSCTKNQTAPNILASYCVMLAYTGKWCKYYCLIGPHFGVNQCLSQTSLWPEDKSYFTFDINLLRGEHRQNIQFSFSLILFCSLHPVVVLPNRNILKCYLLDK